MDEPIQTRERAQLAIVGIALTLAALMVVALASTPGDAWRWLMLGGPVAMIVGAASRLRRIRATGQPD